MLQKNLYVMLLTYTIYLVTNDRIEISEEEIDKDREQKFSRLR